jgi:hypothetical protein
MAEIVVTHTTTSRTVGGTTTTSTIRRIAVLSVSPVDVAAILDFAAALNEAGIPGRAPVNVSKGAPGNVSKLVAEWETVVPLSPSPNIDDPA